MPTDRDVQRLVREAASATTLQEQQRLIGAAEEAKTAIYAEAARDREVDLSHAIVQELLTPVSVHEHHTAATDWLGDVDTDAPTDMDNRIVAQASLWYTNLHPEVKAYPAEFDEQARGRARKIAGAYGASADAAEDLFLSHVASIHDREVRAGVVKIATPAPTAPDTSTMPSGTSYEGLPESVTTSERAPAIQALENNNGAGGATDVVPVNDPGLGAVDTQVDRANGDLGDQSVADLTSQVDRTSTASRHTAHKENRMQQAHAQCPTCGGHGRVAVRVAPQPTIEDIVRMGVSGLDQVDQIVDPHDNGPNTNPAPGQSETYPTDVAFPWTMAPSNVQQTIQQAESQIADRNGQMSARSGQATASRKERAQQVAREAYRRVMAGQDDSGWIGDMGAAGYGPGEQDWNPATEGGANNLGTPDPVYPGGDNPSRPLKPYGAAEADDETNKPSQWAPGQPTQMDMAGRGEATNGAPAPGFPNAPMSHGAARVEDDPKLNELLALARKRRAFLESRSV